MIRELLTQSNESYQKANGISRSMLDWIHPPRTPAHFKAKYIDSLIPEKETAALRMGTITHRAILEPDTMENAFHVEPASLTIELARLKKLKSAKVIEKSDDKAIVEWNPSFAEADAWYAEHTDRPVIRRDEAKAMTAMRDAVWRHPLAKRLLSGAKTEQSAFAEHDGQLLKARFDAVPKSGNALPDMKTCESAFLDDVEKQIGNEGYFRQAAHYLKVDELIGLGHAVFLFILVEKSPPFEVAVYQLSDDVINAGRMLIERDLQLLRNCMEKNEWPGYGNDVMTAALPSWMMKSLEQQL